MGHNDSFIYKHIVLSILTSFTLQTGPSYSIPFPFIKRSFKKYAQPGKSQGSSCIYCRSISIFTWECLYCYIPPNWLWSYNSLLMGCNIDSWISSIIIKQNGNQDCSYANNGLILTSKLMGFEPTGVQDIFYHMRSCSGILLWLEPNLSNASNRSLSAINKELLREISTLMNVTKAFSPEWI